MENNCKKIAPRRKTPGKANVQRPAAAVPTTAAGIAKFYGLVGLPADTTMPFGMSAEEFGRRTGEIYGHYDGSHTVLLANAGV